MKHRIGTYANGQIQTNTAVCRCPERAQGFKGPKTVIHDATIHVQIRVAERPISEMPGSKNKLRTAFGKREQWSRKR